MEGLKRKSPLTGISGFGEWCRGTESNCRHGDFQPFFQFGKKPHIFNSLIMFDIFSAILETLGKI